MDSMADINSPYIEADELQLSDNHPGRHDAEYIRRRKMFFYLARDHRLRELTSPFMTYTLDEIELWNYLYAKLDKLHMDSAAQVFLEGKASLGLKAAQIPQLPTLEALLSTRTGVRLVPAEGLLHGKSYFGYWARRIMPCTLFIRHASAPKYTPEPDIVHDIIGHVPALMNSKYVELIELIGQMARLANPKELEQLVRFYWFTVEFGLVQERQEMRILGAGILSSIGETEYVMNGGPKIRPFHLEEVLETPFDPTNLQPLLFVSPSLEYIIEEARKLSRILNKGDKNKIR